MRRLILNLHLYTALLAGVFMVIQGITGSIMAFEPELDRAFHPHLAYIRPGTRVLSLKQISDSVSRQLGGEPIVAFGPSLSAELTYEVLLPSGIAYVNQYTGQVLGVRVRGQTLLGYIRDFHVRLGVGAIGRDVLRGSAVAALISVLSGLYLWWPTKRIRIRLAGDSRRFWLDMHSVVGICSVIPLALLAASGLVLGFEDQAAALIHKLAEPRPAPVLRPQRRATSGTPMIEPDAALAIACSRIPGAVPYRIQMPQYGGLYRIELVDLQDRVAGSRNVVALDPTDGTIVSLSRSADLSRADWILAANEAVHTGSILGLPGRVVASLASMIIFLQAISGALIWFHRNRILPGSSGGLT